MRFQEPRDPGKPFRHPSAGQSVETASGRVPRPPPADLHAGFLPARASWRHRYGSFTTLDSEKRKAAAACERAEHRPADTVVRKPGLGTGRGRGSLFGSTSLGSRAVGGGASPVILM